MEHTPRIEFVGMTADYKRNRLARFQRCVNAPLCLSDSDLDKSAAPLKAKGEATPIRRQLRIDGYALACQ